MLISAKLKCYVFTPAREGEISKRSSWRWTGNGLHYKVGKTMYSQELELICLEYRDAGCM